MQNTVLPGSFFLQCAIKLSSEQKQNSYEQMSSGLLKIMGIFLLHYNFPTIQKRPIVQN